MSCTCPEDVRFVGRYVRGCREHDPKAHWLDGLPANSDYMIAIVRENWQIERECRMEAVFKRLESVTWPAPSLLRR